MNNEKTDQKRGALVKTQRTEEFSDYVTGLKMYKDLMDSSAESHVKMIKQISQKSVVLLSGALTDYNQS